MTDEIVSRVAATDVCFALVTSRIAGQQPGESRSVSSFVSSVRALWTTTWFKTVAAIATVAIVTVGWQASVHPSPDARYLSQAHQSPMLRALSDAKLIREAHAGCRAIDRAPHPADAFNARFPGDVLSQKAIDSYCPQYADAFRKWVSTQPVSFSP